MYALVWILVGVTSIVLGGVAAFVAGRVIASRRLATASAEAAKVVEEAKSKQKEILLEAKEEGIKHKVAVDAEYRDRRAELQRQERRLTQKEEGLERKLEAAERRDRSLTTKERGLDETRGQLEEMKKKQVQQLETVSTMSSAEAKQFLLQAVEAEVREDLSRRAHELEVEVKQQADEKARDILSLAIQRCATEVLAENTVSVVPLPSDEMKGRLIGREGRNIRALEQATGVDLIIDDTPEAVTLSSFDPVRREVARIALNKLILDGRIHPARIEEVVEKAKTEVDAAIQAEGEQAAYKAGVHGLHPELIKMLGRLKYRTSYGQNVLQHSIEVASLSKMIASELGADVEVAKRAGLLHDIGKAIDRDVEGPHAQIGANLVQRWESSPRVARAVGEHHNEAGTTSVDGFIVTAADAISGGRPGARGESLERYLKRLEALESIANSFPGVEKSFAVQAGREVRIMVKPEAIDDLGAVRLARDIVKKIQETLQYPGQIKVTVIRETRAVDIAK